MLGDSDTDVVSDDDAPTDSDAVTLADSEGDSEVLDEDNNSVMTVLGLEVRLFTEREGESDARIVDKLDTDALSLALRLA